MRITLIGHCTILIEIEGRKILTDPYFGLWGNPIFARLAPPIKSRQELTDVDLVLVSHDHWDHMDSQYLRLLAGDVPVVTPKLMSWLFKLYGAKNLVGLNAWESFQLRSITVSAVPALHLTSAIGFVIQGENRQVYFAGDTFYHSFMEQMGQKFQLDVALMPVTTFRVPMTMGEKGAVRAVQALKPATVIPVHLDVTPRWPFFRTNQSPEGFIKRLRAAGLKTPVVLLREGKSWSL